MGTFIYFLGDIAILPNDDDEYVYYNSARLFCHTTSIQAPDADSEDVSVFFSTNWYGGIYHLFYGLPAKVIGPDASNFFLIHVGLILISVIIIYRLYRDKRAASWIVFGWLSVNMTIPMAYTFYPETLQTVMGVGLTCLIIRTVGEQDDRRRMLCRRLLAGLLLVAVILRPTWAIWSLALLPLSRSRRELVVSSVVVVTTFAWAVIYSRLFCAEYRIQASAVLGHFWNLEFGTMILELIRNTLANAAKVLQEAPKNDMAWGPYLVLWFKILIFNPFLILKVYLFAMLGVYTWYVARERKTMDIIVLLVALSFVLMLLAMYSPASAYFVRLVMPVLFLVTAGVFISGRTWLKVLTGSLGVYLLFLSVLVSIYFIRQSRAAAHEVYVTHQEATEHLSAIAQVMEPDKPAVVQMLYYDDFDFPYSVFGAAVPFHTLENETIMYTATPIDRSLPVAERFRRRGKLEIDYVLSHHELVSNDLELLLQSPHFLFYRDHRKDVVETESATD